MAETLTDIINNEETPNFPHDMSIQDRFEKVRNSVDFSANPYLQLSDAEKASFNPTNVLLKPEDITDITSDTETIIANTFRKSLLDLQSTGDRMAFAIGNTLAGVSGDTLGAQLRNQSADSLLKMMEESRFIDSNLGDAETWTAKFTGGALSFAELVALGTVGGAAASGAFIGAQSLSNGGLNDIQKYLETHDSLEGYETDPVNLALDYLNAVFQIATEHYLGTGRLVNGKVLQAGKTSSAIAKEVLDNFIQEAGQGMADDVTEILKGNEDLSILAENAWGYVQDGIIGAILGGVAGGTMYHANKTMAKQKIHQINQVLHPNATEEELAQHDENVWRRTEEKVLKSFAPELIAEAEAVNDRGKIRENLRQKVEAMYRDADMSEKQKVQAIEATTTVELENLLYDTIERKIPITSHPILQGEVNELGWFRNGIPANRRSEIDALNKEITDLKAQQKELLSQEQVNYKKLGEIEDKIDQFNRTLPEKIKDLVVEDRNTIRDMLNEQRNRLNQNMYHKQVLRKIQETAKKAELDAEKLAGQMAEGAEKARATREQRETAQQTKEAKIRNLREQREIASAIKRLKYKTTVEKTNKTSEMPWWAMNQVAPIAVEDLRELSLPQQWADKITITYKGDTFDIVRGWSDYTIHLVKNGERVSAITVEDNGKVQETFTDADYREQGNAGKIVEVAENLFGPLTITIAEGNTDAEEFWFGRDYTKEIAPRTYIKDTALASNEQFNLATENARLDAENPPHEGETITVDGKERTVYNSNGDRIAQSAEALTNFWRWFGDSKVVDEQGRPLVVYHGTDAKFDTFDNTNVKTGAVQGAGYYFANKGKANKYGKIRMPVYLSIQNPFVIDTGDTVTKAISNTYDISRFDIAREFGIGDNSNPNYPEPTAQAITDFLKSKGHDGVWSRETKNTYELTAFEPNQIKSTGNRGTFSPDTGNIYKQGRADKATGKDTSRGAYFPEYRFIQKTANMDASTLAHELAHDWGQENFRWMRSGKASPEFMRAWGAVEKAIGITKNDTYFTYDASEKFARAYESWLMQREDWSNILKIENDKDRKDVEQAMEDYRRELVDIYDSLTNEYFQKAWGKAGELKPELAAWFERSNKFDSLDARVDRGEITKEEAAEEKLSDMVTATVNESVDNMPVVDKRTVETLQTLDTLEKDAKKFEVEGGNVNRLQRRLNYISLAKDMALNNDALGRHETHRDMVAAAQAADDFVRTRLDDALAIINGEMAEQDGIFSSELYTALLRKASAENDFNLLDDLRNSKIANELAKEMGQRVAGFRDFTGSGDLDVMSALKALDKRYEKAYGEKQKQKVETELKEYDSILNEQDKIADGQLEEILNEMECQ